jgi:hypothetical protein
MIRYISLGGGVGFPNRLLPPIPKSMPCALPPFRTQLYRRNVLIEPAISHLTRFLTSTSINTLFIGFARRFATCKRASLAFRDLSRLARVVSDPERPVVFVFAAKAHPADGHGQELVRELYEISMRPEFQGRVLMLEDYSLAMARILLPGVDVWLNTPGVPVRGLRHRGKDDLSYIAEPLPAQNTFCVSIQM